MKNSTYLKLLPLLPPPSEIEYQWDCLTIGIKPVDSSSYPDMVDSLWEVLFTAVDESRKIDIDFGEEAWFHLRRRFHQHQDQKLLNYSWGRIELLRLKKGFITNQKCESIRVNSGTIGGVSCAGWWPLNFTERHDNTFLSFIQKLSVLRIENGIFHENFLGRITPGKDYNECPFCREAYEVMMAPKNPWSESLIPWFNYMTETKMDASKTHEYAHWFGHILSGWSEGASQ